MATTIVEQSGGQYHVLVIIADGQVCLAYCKWGKNETYLSIIMAFSEVVTVQVTRSVDTEFGQLSTQEQMTVDAIVQAR